MKTVEIIFIDIIILTLFSLALYVIYKDFND
jgi:hypothetical protein